MTTTSETAFGDLNGPLMYWGPSLSARTESRLTIAEQDMLLRLRARLEGTCSGTIGVTEALDTLLDARQLVGSSK